MKKFFAKLIVGFVAVVLVSFFLTTIINRTALPPNVPTPSIPPNVNDPMKFVNSIPLEEGTKLGWKKYINTVQGYSIEFPSSYTSDSIIANSLQLFDKETFREKGPGPSKNKLHITITGPENLQVEGSVKNLESYIKEGQAKDSGIQKVIWRKINGNNVAIEGYLDYYSTYYFFNNGYIYTISKGTSDLEMNDEFQQIVSTFEFI